MQKKETVLHQGEIALWPINMSLFFNRIIRITSCHYQFGSPILKAAIKSSRLCGKIETTSHHCRGDETLQHKSGNISWQHSIVTRQDRQLRIRHNSCALWFTGLSGSGKSTLAFALEKELHARNISSYVLDGDNIRHGLNRDLGFSSDDRKENIRRIGEVSKLFVDAGLFVLSAFISPDEKDRLMVKEMFQPGDHIEIYVKCSLTECEKEGSERIV